MMAVTIYSLLSLGLLAGALFFLLRPVIRMFYAKLKGGGGILAALLLLSGSILLLRPHQEALTGLDDSAYRLMAQAMREGRPLFETDELLLQVPEPHRAAFLFRPNMTGHGRLTRDRSYALDDLTSCMTRPFYYPLLPFTANGLDLIIPGPAADGLIPVLGILTLLTLMCLGIARRRWPGMLLAWVLFFSTPLPVWLFRGWYSEAVAGSLLCLSLVNLLLDKNTIPRRALCFALGLMISYHVSFLVIALPLLIAVLMLPPDGNRRISSAALFFPAGLLPLFWQTQFICKPYGGLAVGSLLSFFRLGATHWLLMVYLAAILAAGSLLLLFRRRTLMLLSTVLESGVLPRLGAVCAAAIPLFCSLVFWHQKHVVAQGLLDAHSAMGLHLELLLGILLLAVLLHRRQHAGLLILLLALLVLPVNLYLKGAELVGLWSQRRLLGTLMLLLPPAVCGGGVIADWTAGRLKGRPLRLAAGAGVITVLVLGLLNAVRWPAPWLLRNEKGSRAYVQSMRDVIGSDLAIIDYHPWSIPLAAVPGSRVLGIGPGRVHDAGAAIPHLMAQADGRRVLFLSAYETHAVLEQDAVLVPVQTYQFHLPHIHSKRALPAVEKEYPMTLTLLKSRRLNDSEWTRRYTRVMGSGVLGFRGPWGRTDIPLKDTAGLNLPARWSREGSGLIGPMPLPGEAVTLTLTCAANRQDGKTQTLLIMPPWSDEAAFLDISNSICTVSVSLTRPPDRLMSGETGNYRIYSVHPYNPARDGIRGFKKDLGALIHSVTFEVQSQD